MTRLFAVLLCLWASQGRFVHAAVAFAEHAGALMCPEL